MRMGGRCSSPMRERKDLSSSFNSEDAADLSFYQAWHGLPQERRQTHPTGSAAADLAGAS
jgi:hypothetical protein